MTGKGEKDQDPETGTGEAQAGMPEVQEKRPGTFGPEGLDPGDTQLNARQAAMREKRRPGLPLEEGEDDPDRPGLLSEEVPAPPTPCADPPEE